MRVDSVPRTVKDALEEFGEILVVTEAGERYELHKHNTVFDRNKGWIVVEGTGNDLFIRQGSIESYQVHYDI